MNFACGFVKLFFCKCPFVSIAFAYISHCVIYQITHTFFSHQLNIQVSGVENLTGHAQITMMRGKKKWMCDFSADVKYVLTVNTTTGDQVRPE